MANTFSVAISYKNALGWIDYDADAKKAQAAFHHDGDADGLGRHNDDGRNTVGQNMLDEDF